MIQIRFEFNSTLEGREDKDKNHPGSEEELLDKCIFNLNKYILQVQGQMDIC